MLSLAFFSEMTSLLHPIIKIAREINEYIYIYIYIYIDKSVLVHCKWM